LPHQEKNVNQRKQTVRNSLLVLELCSIMDLAQEIVAVLGLVMWAGQRELRRRGERLALRRHHSENPRAPEAAEIKGSRAEVSLPDRMSGTPPAVWEVGIG
jgi:hypothetical protein